MAGVNLDMGKLDGSTVNEKDFRKLYFVYLSSKTEDWNFILEVLLPALLCSRSQVNPQSNNRETQLTF